MAYVGLSRKMGGQTHIVFDEREENHMVILILALVAMTILAVIGVPILIASPVLGFFVALLSGLGLYDAMATTYMGGLSNYVLNYFLMFVLGALFGKLCEISGATESIAQAVVDKFGEKHIMLGIIVASAILAFGGVNLFVALFAIYPLAMSMFRRADIPRRLFPAAYIAGAGTFAMTAPFTPSTQNIIPTSYLGTSLSAGAIPGVIGSIFCAVAVCVYMQWRTHQVKSKGEHFEPIPGEDIDIEDKSDLPNVFISLVPLVALIVILNVTNLPIIGSLTLGLLIAFAVYFKWLPHNLAEFWKHINAGAQNGIMSLINTAAIVGFGSVVTTTPAFTSMATQIEGWAANGNAYLIAAVAVAVMAGISGSASGGLGIAVPIAADIFLPMGVSAGALHRIATVASSALDSLPHNGFVNTCLQYSKSNHAKSYFDIFIVSIVITIIELALVIALFSIGLG